MWGQYNNVAWFNMLHGYQAMELMPQSLPQFFFRMVIDHCYRSAARPQRYQREILISTVVTAHKCRDCLGVATIFAKWMRNFRQHCLHLIVVQILIIIIKAVKDTFVWISEQAAQSLQPSLLEILPLINDNSIY